MSASDRKQPPSLSGVCPLNLSKTTKWTLALDLYSRLIASGAKGNGVRFIIWEMVSGLLFGKATSQIET